MEGRQAVHKDGARRRVFHDGAVHTVGRKNADPLLPDAVRLAHGDPHVGVDHVGVRGARLHVLREGDGADLAAAAAQTVGDASAVVAAALAHGGDAGGELFLDEALDLLV